MPARRLLLAHLLTVVGEWSVTVGVLVHAFAWGGPSAVGVASVAVLVPSIAGAPLVGAAMARWRTHAVRSTALAVQAVALAAAAAAASLGAPAPAVAPFVVLALAMVTVVPPTSAALLPRIARSADELVAANLWVTHFDSASALAGSLTAGVLVGLGGPEAAFAAAGIGAVVALVATVWRPAPLARSARGGGASTSRRSIRRALDELRAHPWSRGVLGVASARNLLVGAFDVLLVLVAIDALGLGASGSGYLGALVGAGALASTVVTATVVRRARLSGGLLVSMGAAVGLAVLLGVRIERPVYFVALPVLGLSMAVMDALSRTLLQRSTDPRNLGPMFAAFGLVAGVGQITGSVVAQVAVAVAGVEAALLVLGALLAVLAACSFASLRRADANADVPVVEMALLAGLPMLSSVPSVALERVARSTRTLRIAPGTAVVEEGAPGDCCYVVADGELDLSAKGTHLRIARRGAVVGEVALLTGLAPSVTVTARTPASVVQIEREPFLVALTGQDVGGGAGDLDFALARARFREVVASHERADDAGYADAWLGLGAVGRILGDPTYTDAVVRGAELARASSNAVLLAEAAAMTTWPGAFFFIAENPDHRMIEVCESALVVLGTDDPMRVRVLATLASNLTFASEPERRRALVDEALALAAAHGDPSLLGAVLSAEFVCLWEPSTLARREVIARQLREVGDPELAYLGGFFTAYCATERGRLEEARRQLVALQAELPATRNQYFEFLTDRLLLSIDIVRCEPGTAARIDALAARHGSTHADTDGTWALQTGGLAHQAGALGTMVPMLLPMLEGPHTRTWRAALALAHLVAGDDAAAAAVLADQGDVPRNYFWVTVVQVQAEVAAGLGLVDRCRVLFDELAPYRGQVGITASGSLCFGLVSRSLGELALALGRHDEAVDLLAEAVGDADERGMPFDAVVARRLLASAHRVRGEHRRAAELVAEARAAAEARGFAREAALLVGAAEAEPV